MKTLNSDANSRTSSPRKQEADESRFTTTNTSFFKQANESVGQAEETRRIHEMHKSTSIGKSERNAAQISMTTQKEAHPLIPLSGIAIGRRNQEEQTGMAIANK